MSFVSVVVARSVVGAVKAEHDAAQDLLLHMMLPLDVAERMMRFDTCCN